MPKQLNNGKITEAMQRAFGFKGRYNPQLDEIIVPVYQIADPVPADPGRTYGATLRTPTQVQSSGVRVRLSNPLGSGVNMSISGISVGARIEAIPGPTKTFDVGFFPLEEADPLTDVGPLPVARDQRNTIKSAAFTSSTPSAPPSQDFLFEAIIRGQTEMQELTDGAAVGVRQPLVVLPPGWSLDSTSFDPAGGADADDIPILTNGAWLEVAIGVGDGGTP